MGIWQQTEATASLGIDHLSGEVEAGGPPVSLVHPVGSKLQKEDQNDIDEDGESPVWPGEDDV